MSTKAVKTSSNGIGFTGFLALLFIGLKLAGYIEWSWFWVLSPIWIPVAIVFLILAIILLLAFTSKH